MLDEGVSARRGHARAEEQNHCLQQYHGRAKKIGRHGQETTGVVSAAEKNAVL